MGLRIAAAVAKSEIGSVIEKLKTALKPGGVLYASFKYGTEERESSGRMFNDYDETTLIQLLHDAGFLVRDIFITEDVREDRPGERWVNVLAWCPAVE